jgi:hypothetical protein
MRAPISGVLKVARADTQVLLRREELGGLERHADLDSHWGDFQLRVNQDTQESWDVFNTTTAGHHDVTGDLSYPCAGSGQDSVRVRISGSYLVEYDDSIQNYVAHYQTFTTDEVVIKCGGH